MMQSELTEQELEALDDAGVEVQINQRKDRLKEYDYIGIKIAMGVATVDEYADEIAYTQQLRAEINDLQEHREYMLQQAREERSIK